MYSERTDYLLAKDLGYNLQTKTKADCFPAGALKVSKPPRQPSLITRTEAGHRKGLAGKNVVAVVVYNLNAAAVLLCMELICYKSLLRLAFSGAGC